MTTTGRWVAAATVLAAVAVVAMAAHVTAGADRGDRPRAMLHDGGPNGIDGSYIVILRRAAVRTPDDLAAVAADLAARYDGRIVHTYPSVILGFSITISAAQVRRLATEPAVAHIQQNRSVRATDTQDQPPWGLDRIDMRQRLPADATYRYTGTGRGVTVYVLDSGIRTTHHDLSGRARHGADFADRRTDRGADGGDCDGHGTHIAGTVAGSVHGVAKRADVVAVRVLGCDGTGTTADAIAGIDWILRTATAPAVVTVAFGAAGVDFLLTFAVKLLIDAGFTTVVAAGNDNTNACGHAPAMLDSAITVAASTGTDARSPFSNHGGCVDLFAPGTDIVSLGVATDTATATTSGTSMAAAHVAGAAALVLETGPTLSPAQAADVILAATTRDTVSDERGSPNRLLHIPGP